MKTFRRNLLVIVALATLTTSAFATLPSDYYNSSKGKELNGKKESALKTAVKDLIYAHTEVSSYSALPTYFKQTDNLNGYWWDMYSNEKRSVSSFSGLQREHSFPKSWWGGLTDVPAYVDLNHLYPSDGPANQAKSNYPLGVVTTTTFNNGVSKIGYPTSGQGGGASRVFEPADEYKGDFARTYFYMVTCYQDLTWASKYSWMLQQNVYPTLTTWAIDLLLKWHREDPVSKKEIDRNEIVYKIQNNRNPFIDYPELAEYIWGNHKGELFYTEGGTTPDPDSTPVLITPTQGTELDFGDVPVGNSVTRQLFFKGEHLTGSLSLTLSKADRIMFQLSSTSIKADLVNATDGYKLNITYKPTALGEHSAKLIVSDGGITGSRGITLTGNCLEVPSLSTIKALDATDISNDSYTANWEASSDEIDGYIITRTKYIDGSAETEEIEVEPDETSVTITDFHESTSETYSVQSIRLGFRSPASNLITVKHDGVTGIKVDKPLGIIVYDDFIRFVCGETTHSGGRIFDATGKLIYYLPVIENNTEINLPFGVYLITTNELSRPLRIVVK